MWCLWIGASEGIRTLDIHLGKVTLYQTELRSLPKKLRYRSVSLAVCNIFFERVWVSPGFHLGFTARSFLTKHAPNFFQLFPAFIDDASPLRYGFQAAQK
jgi:hypothetical protein